MEQHSLIFHKLNNQPTSSHYTSSKLRLPRHQCLPVLPRERFVALLSSQPQHLILADLLGNSCELGILAGFALVFALALIVVSLFTPLIAGAVANSALGPVDQGLGFLFGIVRGVLLVVIALVVYSRIFGEAGGVPQIDNSHSVAVLAGLEARIAAMLANWRWATGNIAPRTISVSRMIATPKLCTRP